MKRVFICSPFRAANLTEWSRNRVYAQQLCRFALDNDFAPFAPHLIYPEILDDENEAERSLGIRAGLMYMQVCQEMWVGNRYGITKGMRFEIEQARKSIRIPSYMIIDTKKGLFKSVFGIVRMREKRPQTDSDVQSQ